MRLNMRGSLPCSWDACVTPSSDPKSGSGVTTPLNPTWFFPRLKLVAIIIVMVSIIYQWTVGLEREKNKSCNPLLASGDVVPRENNSTDYVVQMFLNVVCNRPWSTHPPSTCCAAAASTSFSIAVIIAVAVTIIVATGLALTLRVFIQRMRHGSREQATPPEMKDQCLPNIAVVSFAKEGGENALLGKKSTSWEILNEENVTNVYLCDESGSRENSRDERSTGEASEVKISSSMSSSKPDPAIPEQKPHPQVAIPMLKLFLILGYFVLSDRIKVLEEVSKHFTAVTFGAPLLFIFVAAVSSSQAFGPGTIKKPVLLSRHVTDEWKGWMQFVLLVYHASGASSNLFIYMHVRVIVSSYLFLTGYGHFSRYWKTGNAGGFTRYFQVMYRLNFLTVLLCLVMDQPYMNYYFVVLVSFWYTVLHLVLALPPHLTESGLERTLADFARGALKIAIVVLTIVLLSNYKVFEGIFGLGQLSALFQLSNLDGLQEWRFRWMLDRFSVLYGMIFALMCQVWTRFWPNNSIGSRWPSTKWGTALLAVLSLSSFACYPLLLQTCDTKQACNYLHPYFTWIPIFGFIFFRHHSSFFRTHFSKLFAFLGQISLELFVSQYHILLASNTHSLLVLTPGQPIINTIVTGLVFLCSAHEISNITDSLQPTLAPSDVKKMIRNMLVFGVVLLLFVYRDRIG